MILPVSFYRDPAECVDEIRRLRKLAQKQAERDRMNKSRRIQALVRSAMAKGGV